MTRRGKEANQRWGWAIKCSLLVVVVAVGCSLCLDGSGQGEVFTPSEFVKLADNVLKSNEFIQQHEIDHILQLVDENGGWEASKTGEGDWLVPKHQKKLAATFNRDTVIREIELRVANYTGIPPHIHEDMLNIARILPRKGGDRIRGGNYFPHGLHHETDTRPHRSKTIIMYLRQPVAGGRTAFPLLGKRTPGAEDLDADLRTQFGGHEQQYGRHVSFDPTLAHPYNTHFENTCKGDFGVSMEPVEGSALMFTSSFGLNRQSDGYLYNEPAWHCGCNVLEGEKIIMTKFKETPMEQRPRRSAHINDKQYIPWDPVVGVP